MDYERMTAPCGLDCFNCIGHLANDNPEMLEVLAKALEVSMEQAEKMVCKGCRDLEGKIPFIPMPCRVYPCVESKGVAFCSDCEDFPCDYLHPYADWASKAPHNTKVFNLCLIKKMGLENWAKQKAKAVKETYFNEKWTL